MRVVWRGAQGQGEAQDTHTAIVNQHGALLYLHLPMPLGQDLRLINRANDQTATARVVWTGDTLPDGSARVGIEFTSPVGYDFWGTLAVRFWEEQQQAARKGWLRHLWAWLGGR